VGLQRLDLRGLEVLDLDRDSLAAGPVDELGGVLDRLRRSYSERCARVLRPVQ